MSELRKFCRILKNCVIKGKKPTKVWVAVTDKCNSHCIHCSIWKKEPVPESSQMTVDDYRRVFSDEMVSDIDTVLLSGGEPTLRSDLREIVLTIHECLPKAHIDIATNALQPDKMINLVRDLLARGFTGFSIGTSIDSLVNHDKIRGKKGAQEKVFYLIERINKIRSVYPEIGLGFGTVLQEANADEIQDIIEYANKNGLNYLIQWFNQSGFYDNENKRRLDPAKERKIVANLPDTHNMIREQWLKYLDGEDCHFDCAALKDFFVLKCNGDISPCLSHWDLTLGNVCRAPISRIWKRESIARIIRHCPGCVNSWGTMWSWEYSGVPYLAYYIKHQIKFLKKMIR